MSKQTDWESKKSNVRLCCDVILFYRTQTWKYDRIKLFTILSHQNPVTYWVWMLSLKEVHVIKWPFSRGCRSHRWQRSCRTWRTKPWLRLWSWRSSWCKETRIWNPSRWDLLFTVYCFHSGLFSLLWRKRRGCVCKKKKKSNFSAQEAFKDTTTQVLSLRQTLKEKDEAIQRQSKLEKKIHELEKQGTIKIHKKGDGDISILTSSPSSTEGLPGATLGVSQNHLGSAGGMAAGPAPPPPPPPLPGNGTCRFSEQGGFFCPPDSSAISV